jgi:hypothetical protein
MSKIAQCKECGVPVQVSKSQTWQTNGVISETKDPDHRMVFFESGNLQNVYRNIEAAIGVSIERIVVESQSRSTREYLEKLISPVVRKLLALFYQGLIATRMANIADLYGYGKMDVLEIKVQRLPFGDHKGDYMVMSVRKPYSIYRLTGDILGGMEASTGRACTASREDVDEDNYRFTMKAGSHPPELKERLGRKKYAQKNGNIELERCPSCGIPIGLARFKWDLENGIIADRDSGRRMAIFGPGAAEAAFEDLEAELGEAIPETVIDAQRQYVKASMKSEDYQNFTSELEEVLALRGLGMLTRFEAGDKLISVTIENACLHLWMVGIIQGLFELGIGKSSTTREWDLTTEGVLTVTVRA